MLASLTVNLSDDPIVNRDLSVAVRHTIRKSTKLFSAGPPAGAFPINVFLQPKGNCPITRIATDPNVYQIGLDLEVYRCPFNQLIFQLGHELCHVFADPRRSNWFVESCCEMMSQVILRQMSETWKNVQIQQPYVDKLSYAIKIKKYAEDRIREATTAVFQTESLPDFAQLHAWFITIKGSLQDDPKDRRRNIIIAEMLRPLFGESATNWDTLLFLGQASTYPPVSLTDLDTNSGFKFNRWLEAVPGHLEDLVSRIREILGNQTPV